MHLSRCLDNKVFVTTPAHRQHRLAFVIPRRLTHQEVAVLSEQSNHLLAR